MSAGKILQIGSPRDIYDHPADRFVADFIGDTNFLIAKLISIGKSTAKVKLPSGKIVTAGLPQGDFYKPEVKDNVTLVIRPEHVSLGEKTHV